ncbi:SDR family NAD(P)-dependent oxidoreductase [Ferrimonas aestuarii]|nr:SDR family NAD(P)-dependent oxidoreductase [Ferrimonas aestuarii]
MKTAVVTGGNQGLGFESCRQLARLGFRIIVASRNLKRGQQAVAQIKSHCPAAQIQTLTLDLANYDSIDRFSDRLQRTVDRVDLLLNNAGVVNLEYLARNHQGIELQMATNHLGHFALTASLLPLLLQSNQPRVVTLTSGGYKWGDIRFDDLGWQQRPYHRVKSYGDSKLANLLFSYQLQQVFDQHQINGISLAAHPGLTGTERQQSVGVGGWLSRFLASPVSQGVQSQMHAATATAVTGGTLWGPQFGLRGKPKSTPITALITNPQIAEQLWQISEQLTGSAWHLPTPSP